MLVVLGSLMFVALGHIFVAPSATIVVAAIGYASIVFFGACLLYALWRLIRRRPGLIISEAGLFDNASPLSAGLIPWGDIVGLEIITFRRQKMLAVFVADPEAMMRRAPAFKRSLMRANVDLVATPIVIPRSALAIGLETLESCVRARLAAHDVSPG
jgi:hypothetical protein